MRIRLTLILLLIVSGSNASAAKIQDVAGSLHNLAFTGPAASAYRTVPFGAGAEDQICVFCHTPHGGTLDGPLWNRNFAGAGVDATGYQFYDSVTLTAEAKAVAKVNDPSLICLSCHDGSLAVGDGLINPGTSAAPSNNNKFIVGIGAIPAARIGGSYGAGSNDTTDLRDDHPISFNYATAQGQDSSLKNIDTGPKAKGLRFYGATEEDLECGTCHDPHVDYVTAGQEAYAPFLAIPNTGSDLCLSCHDK